MKSNGNSLSLDSVLNFMQEYVAQQGTRVQGTVLAQAIRTEFPGFKYEEVGYENLVGLIDEAENRKLLVRHRDVIHVEVSCCADTPRIERVGHAGRPSRILPDIWRAFVFANQPEHQFLDRVTGQVVTGQRDEPAQAGEAPRYVRIAPISAERQKEWMWEFVRQEGLDESGDNAKNAIETDSCWLTFPQWLGTRSRETANRWLSFRTRRVTEHLKSWAAEHDIRLASLLDPEGGRHSEPVRRRTTNAEAALRKAIIAALNDLPLDRLEDISIPFRYVLRYFEPRH